MISRFLSLFWGHARAHFTHWNWYLTSAKSLRWEALHIGGSMWAGQRGWLESPEVHSLLRSRESFAECESLGSALGPFYSEISRLPALGDLKYHLFGHVWGRLANPAAPTRNSQFQRKLLLFCNGQPDGQSGISWDFVPASTLMYRAMIFASKDTMRACQWSMEETQQTLCAVWPIWLCFVDVVFGKKSCQKTSKTAGDNLAFVFAGHGLCTTRTTSDRRDELDRATLGCASWRSDAASVLYPTSKNFYQCTTSKETSNSGCVCLVLLSNWVVPS